MRWFSLSVLALAVSAVAVAADEPAEETPAAPSRPAIGEPAPAFTLPDLDGEEVSLSDHAGRFVVLEWFNPECPYVVYANNEGGPLAEWRPEWSEKEVVWIHINSNVPGTQGSDPAVNRTEAERWGIETVLLDVDSAVGRTYGARVTPQMYIIDPEGTLLYDGAVDNAPLGRVAGGGHEPWLADALTAATSGEPVRRARNQAYGCTVKYDSP